MLASLLGSLSIAFTLLGGPKVTAQSDSFPDVPDNHWAYEFLAKCHKLGLLPEIHLFRTGTPYSKYEIASFTVRVTMNLEPEGFSKDISWDIANKGKEEALSREKLLLTVCRDLRRLDLELHDSYPRYINPYSLADQASQMETNVFEALRPYSSDGPHFTMGH